MPTIAQLITGRPLITLPSTASTMQAARTMMENRVGAILVVDDGKPVGMFTERDLMTRVVVPGLDIEATKIDAVMSRDLFMARATDKVGSIRKELQQRHIRHLPVLEGEKVVAMLSLRDLLYADLQEIQVEIEALTEYVQGGAEELPKGLED